MTDSSQPPAKPSTELEPSQPPSQLETQPEAQSQQVGDLVARLTRDEEDLPAQERARLLGRLAAALASSARAAGGKAVLGGRWIADLLVDIAPRIPVRDAATLSAHHNGLAGEALADALVRSAARSTATVGAAGGGIAAVQYAAPPSLLTAPVKVAAETLVVAAIEIKLVAELHEVYGQPVHGSGTERAVAYVQAWASRRGVDPLIPGSVTAVLGQAAKHRLRRRIAGRLGRGLTTMGPFLSGAVAGGWVNHAETRRLAGKVREDLNARAMVDRAYR